MKGVKKWGIIFSIALMMITGLHVLTYDNSGKIEEKLTFSSSEYRPHSRYYHFSTFEIDKMLYFNISSPTNFSFLIQKYDTDEIFPDLVLPEDYDLKTDGYLILGIHGDLEKSLHNDIIEKYSSPTNLTNIEINITLSNYVRGFRLSFYPGNSLKVFYWDIVVVYTDITNYYYDIPIFLLGLVCLIFCSVKIIKERKNNHHINDNSI